MTAEVETQYKLIPGLVELPLCKFIECAVDGNLQVLVVEGEAPDDILAAHWNDLQQTYAELLGGAEAKLSLNLYKQIHRLHATLVQIYTLIDVLRLHYAQWFADTLNGLLMTRFPFDVTNEEEYNSNLEACINRSKALEVQIQLKQKSWEEIQKGSEGGEKVTREYFQNVLIALSDHSKYMIPDTISTYEYCMRIVRLNQFLTALNNRK